MQARSWLYVAGKPVVCTRVMELAALVSSINPTLTPTIDVDEVAQMQHKLLWLLHDGGKFSLFQPLRFDSVNKTNIITVGTNNAEVKQLLWV